MATLNDTRSTLLSDLGPLGGRGELTVVGQMAMAIDHGGRRAMLTGGVGSPIGGWLSVTQEAATESWAVHLLYQAPLGVGGVSKAEKDCAPFSYQIAAQSTA